MNTPKIKLVVVSDHTLGYIHPETPNQINVLWGFILKGGKSWGSVIPLPIFNKNETIRLASEKDFNDFNVCFKGYKNNPEEYEFLT
jgi:hypothetical protein